MAETIYNDGSLWVPTNHGPKSTFKHSTPVDGQQCKTVRRIKSMYIIGALKNKEIPLFANQIQELGIEGFADWFTPGPEADGFWREYSKTRGLSYKEALASYGAQHIFQFDKSHIDRCDAAVMLMPAGKSGHLELGYVIGKGKPGYIVFEEEPDRYDVMTNFATDIFLSREEFLEFLTKNHAID